MLKKRCQTITQDNDPIKDIHSLRKYITANELVIIKGELWQITCLCNHIHE